jgi:hypothetical protein
MEKGITDLTSDGHVDCKGQACATSRPAVAHQRELVEAGLGREEAGSGEEMGSGGEVVVSGVEETRSVEVAAPSMDETGSDIEKVLCARRRRVWTRRGWEVAKKESGEVESRSRQEGIR